MNSEELIKIITQLWIDLQRQTTELESEKREELECAQYALMKTDEAIRTLKSWVIPHNFDSWESEITFFKELKPLFFAKHIYYNKVITLLSSMPCSGKKNKKKRYEQEFDKIQFFHDENTDFHSYYRKKATNNDIKYFMRFKYDLDEKLPLDFHNYDERFSTTHDHLIATILANAEFETFLKFQLNSLTENKVKQNRANITSVQWTGPKVALSELIVAIHETKYLNGGTLSLSDTVRWFETHLSTDVGNYHKTMTEINSRKTNRTKFIQLLDQNLTTYLDLLEE